MLAQQPADLPGRAARQAGGDPGVVGRRGARRVRLAQAGEPLPQAVVAVARLQMEAGVFCCSPSAPFRLVIRDDMPRMWVGPPAISRSAPRTRSAVALVTGTQATSEPGWLTRIPAAIASATWRVLPNTLSYTMTVRIFLTSDSLSRFPAWPAAAAAIRVLGPDAAG